MTDIVEVTVAEDTLAVSVDSGTPEVTITDLNNPLDVTVISAAPVEVVVTDQKPIVNVNLGMGGLFDRTNIVELLEDTIDMSMLSEVLKGNISDIQDLLQRVGDDVWKILIDADVDSITQTAMSYTDEEIRLTAIDILKTAEEVMLAKASTIIQTSSEIALDVVRIEQENRENWEAETGAFHVYSDKIEAAVLHLVKSDGYIADNHSLITQTATEILQEVAERVSTIDGTLDEHTASLSLTARQLSAEIIARSNTDGIVTSLSSSLALTAQKLSVEISDRTIRDGVVDEHSSLFIQTASAIVAEATARQELANGIIAENTANITLTAEALTTTMTSVDTLTGNTDSLTERLTATERVTEILSEGFMGSAYSFTSLEKLTANSFGVSVTTDNNGIPYIAGLELIVHPDWVASTDTFAFNYSVGDTVDYLNTGDTIGKIYTCILAHDSVVATSPSSTNADLYWELVADSAKSDFTISAEHFKIVAPTGTTNEDGSLSTAPINLFDVDATTGRITVSAEFVVQSIESLNYGIAGESWFKLDPVTGSAEFNNLKMTFSTSEKKEELQYSLGIDPDDTPLLLWSGSQLLTEYISLATAHTWDFESTNIGYGAMVNIEIEVPDDFHIEDTPIHVALNEDPLTYTLFGDLDFGDLINVNDAFDNESSIMGFYDFSSNTGDSIDLGEGDLI